MASVIVLSSDEEEGNISMRPTQKIEPNSSLPHEPVDCVTIDDFDFGTDMCNDIFSLESDELTSSSLKNCEHNRLSSGHGRIQRKPRLVHDLSDSDDASDPITFSKTHHSSDDELPDIDINFGRSCSELKMTEKLESYNGLSTTSSRKNNESKLGKNQELQEKQRRKQTELAEKVKQRQNVKEERERKKKEAAQAKALKQATVEIERSKKPGECLKWVTSILDRGLLNADYSGELLTALRTSEVDYRVEENIVPCSVTWERRLQNVQIDDDMKVHKTTTTQNEAVLLIVWKWNKFVTEIHEDTLHCTIEEILSFLSDREMTLIIFGLEDYFKFQKTQKSRNVRAEVSATGLQKRKPKEGTIEAAPVVSRGDVEFALAELQVRWNIGHRCINSNIDMANIVCQFTKAVAEAPFKREKQQKDADRLNWYAVGDSKDCVVVDKDGNGSFQLWQRQLCQFPLASRETSEAISSVYPSPLSLLQAYEGCSNEEEAQSLLEDIPVRRGPGPLATSRRIGPQLSKKIHTFFTTLDEDCIIAPD